MDVSLQALINLYDFSTGRRLFALARVMRVAGEHAFSELEAHCAVALKHDKGTRAMENEWAAPAEKASRIQPIDIKLDRALVSLRDAAQAHANGDEEDEEIRREVRALLTAIFPKGVTAIIQLPCVEELIAVEGILETLKNKRFAPLVSELGLGRIVKRVVKLLPDYRAALEATDPERVTFDKVRAARRQGQDLLLEAVARILGKHPSNKPDDVTARAALLAPILEQNEAIRAYLASRRTVQDVNPETGAVDPSAPTGDSPSPAAAPASPDATPTK